MSVIQYTAFLLCVLALPSTNSLDAAVFTNPDLLHMDIVWSTEPPPNAGYQTVPLSVRSSLDAQYDCFLPLTDASPRDNEDSEETPALPSTLLLPLKNQCLMRFESYWSYEICFGQNVRQFHEAKVVTTDGAKKEPKLTEYILGRRPKGEKAPDWTSKPIEKPPTMLYEGQTVPYYSETYPDGEVCDLTNMPRVTEVRFLCQEQLSEPHVFASIMEVSSCTYQAIVLTTHLCDNPVYKVKQKQKKTIYCQATDDVSSRNAKPQELLAWEEVAEVERQERQKRLRDQQRVRQEQKKARQAQEEVLKQQSPTVPGHVTASAAGTTIRRSKLKTSKPSVPAPPPLSAKQAKQELKKFLNGKLCFSGGRGWWKFEFCPYKHVLQFHQNANGKRDVVVLGKWNEGYHVKQFAKSTSKHTKQSFTHYYKDGEYCDEVQKDRKVRVRMRCSKVLQGAQVSLSLEEPRTCEYVLKVESALFCEALPVLDEHGIPQL